MQKWEYRIVSAALVGCEVTYDGTREFDVGERPELGGYLNALGAKGWEVIAMSRDSSGISGLIILMRPY